MNYKTIFLSLILTSSLSACGNFPGPKPTIEIVETFATEYRDATKPEPYKQNNCGGNVTVENEESIAHSVNYSIEVGTEFEVNANGEVGIPGNTANIELGTAVADHFGYTYGIQETRIKSIKVGAQPGTYVEHLIKIEELWRVGTAIVTIGEQKVEIPYKFRDDFRIVLVDSIEKNEYCIYGTPTPIPTSSQTSASNSNSLPTPTPIYIESDDKNQIIENISTPYLEDSESSNGQTPTPVEETQQLQSDNTPTPNLSNCLSNRCILFFSYRDDKHGEIYVMNTDGTGLNRLSYNPGNHDGDAVWSPDGKQIAFTSFRESENKVDVYIMNADGSNLTRLSDNQYSSWYPSWAPDSNRIVYTVSQGQNNEDVYIMNLNDFEQVRLTTGMRITHPLWSPDGKRIAFVNYKPSGSNQIYELYIISADGSNLALLYEGIINELGSGSYTFLTQLFSWSPDSKRIAFSIGNENSSDIYVINTDGSNLTRLTDNPSFNFNPAWSPNNDQIAFETSRDGSRDIYIMNADGTGQTNLTNHPEFDYNPVWSPKGDQIAFMTRRDDGVDIYIMNADGTGQTNLTNHPEFDGYPAWKP